MIDLRRKQVTCPAGAVAALRRSGAKLCPIKCGACFLKPLCTTDERRRRVVVEHSVARVGSIHGPRARYKGVRKNELDLNRAAAVANLHLLARLREAV